MLHISNICWSNLRTFYGISVEFWQIQKAIEVMPYTRNLTQLRHLFSLSVSFSLRISSFSSRKRNENWNAELFIWNKIPTDSEYWNKFVGEKTLPNRSTLKRFGGKSEKIDNDDEVILLEYHKSFFFCTFCWLNICVECKRMAFV